MTTAQFPKTYRTYLQKNQNPTRAQKEKQYLYSDLKHYGVSTWERRKFSKTHQAFLKNLSKKQTLALVKHFWSRPSFEERSMALHILNLHATSLSKKDMPLIERLMRESRGWAFLDSLIIPIMPHLLEKDKTIYSYLSKWIKDNDFWVRRSALLAQLLFFRAGQGGDKKLFFKFAESQLDESWIPQVYTNPQDIKRTRFFIRKAIGWTLREMSLKDPDSVVQFLSTHKSEMSGLTFREASRRLPPSLSSKL